MRTRRRPAVAGLALLLAAGLAALSPASATGMGYRDGDTSAIALNILPPGQGAHLNTTDLAAFLATGGRASHHADQAGMYEDLIRAEGTLTAADLGDLFKDASFGVHPGGIARTYQPRTGVTVLRDADYNVPHVYGTTRADTMFGAGYVSAEDRLFMMDLLRHISRGRMSEFLGASEDNLASDRAQRLVADYTEEELEAMGTRLSQLDPVWGAHAQADLENFTAGVNAYIDEALLDPLKLPGEYPALQLVPEHWKATDSIALATLIGGTFSVGGGGQLRNAQFLNALVSEGYTPAAARAVFDDLRFANDSEAPVSSAAAFPFNDALGPIDADSVAMPDPPSACCMPALQSGATLPRVVDGPFGRIPLFAEHHASNALLVNKENSTSGRPIAVFGPQVGYYNPEILMEMDLHGPGVHARGAAFPGISLYVLLGRGTGYGWSATTAIGDHTDIRAVKLCEPGATPATLQSKHYLRDGVCRPMYEREDSWFAKPGAAGTPSSPAPGNVLVKMTTQRVQLGDPGGRAAGLGNLPIGPDWAIVVARGEVDGRPVAFARQRSSYGIEVDATLAFTKIHDPAQVNDIEDLMRAFGDYFSFSFNWHLIDKNDVAFYTTGRYPKLAPGVDPDLPFWGDSEWDWTGFLSYEEHPHAVSPPSGYIANWNNKQAPRFRAADDWWSYGPVGRMGLLEDGLKAELLGDDEMGVVDVVRVMGNAATQDLRGRYVLPLILDVIGTPSDPALADAVSALSSWVAGGAHRRDLSGDKIYEDAIAVALMDELWEPALQAAFEPALGNAYSFLPQVHDDAAGPGGSAYLEGWYGQLQKDLRQVLGRAVPEPFSRTYCGGGVLADCRAALTAALAQARTNVVALYGPDEADWGIDCLSDDPDVCEDLWAKDAIEFTAVGVPGMPEMAWQNRPTFQQVLEFA